MAVTLASDALCTLAQAKRANRVSGNLYDDELTELINIVTDRAKRVIGTGIAAANYREWYAGDQEATIILKHRPLIYVERVGYGQENGIEIQYTGSAIRAMVQVYEDGVRTVSTASDGTQTTTSSTFATSPTNSTMATTLTGLTDWTATAQGDDARSYDLHPIGGRDAKTNAVMLTYPDQDAHEYRIEQGTGLLRFHTWPLSAYDELETLGAPTGWQNILVEYRAGYETVPDDIVGVCVDTVATLFAQQTHDRSVASEGIGGYSVTNIDQMKLEEILRERLRHHTNLAVGGLTV